MSVSHVVGVDPGLVHTGVVELVFDSRNRRVEVKPHVVQGTNPVEVQQLAAPAKTTNRVVFIEKYQPRSHLNSDARMMEFQSQLKQALPKATVVLNTGVKKVVRKPLMELLGVWKFGTVTHHQDLRSAARIALLGMLKSEPLNRLLSDVVRDHLRGEDWDVRVGQ